MTADDGTTHSKTNKQLIFSAGTGSVGTTSPRSH